MISFETPCTLLILTTLQFCKQRFSIIKLIPTMYSLKQYLFYMTIIDPDKHENQNYLTPPQPENANFNPKYFILSKVYTDEAGMK